MLIEIPHPVGVRNDKLVISSEARNLIKNQNNLFLYEKMCNFVMLKLYNMKRIIYTLVLLFISIINANSQDVIVKKDNSTIISKVTKVSQTEIEYKKWSNLDGPTYTINKSEVSSVNYENGDRDVFEKQIENVGVTKHMKRVGRNLVLDHVVLTDEEVRNIYGEEYYETYKGARQQMGAGTFFAIVFVGSLCWDIICFANMVFEKDNALMVTTWGRRAVLGGVVGDISLPLMCVFRGIGKGRLNWLANEYNQQNQGYSLNLSPSIIRCNTPQSQNNYGIGLTLSLNF